MPGLADEIDARLLGSATAPAAPRSLADEIDAALAPRASHEEGEAYADTGESSQDQHASPQPPPPRPKTLADYIRGPSSQPSQMDVVYPQPPVSRDYSAFGGPNLDAIDPTAGDLDHPVLVGGDPRPGLAPPPPGKRWYFDMDGTPTLLDAPPGSPEWNAANNPPVGGMVRNLGLGALQGLTSMSPEMMAIQREHPELALPAPAGAVPAIARGVGASGVQMLTGAAMGGPGGGIAKGFAFAAPMADAAGLETYNAALAETGDPGKAGTEALARAGANELIWGLTGNLTRMLGSPQVAEKLVQDGILKAMAKGAGEAGSAGFVDHVAGEVATDLIRHDQSLNRGYVMKMLTSPTRWEGRLEAAASAGVPGALLHGASTAVDQIRAGKTHADLVAEGRSRAQAREQGAEGVVEPAAGGGQEQTQGTGDVDQAVQPTTTSTPPREAPTANQVELARIAQMSATDVQAELVDIRRDRSLSPDQRTEKADALQSKFALINQLDQKSRRKLIEDVTGPQPDLPISAPKPLSDISEPPPPPSSLAEAVRPSTPIKPTEESAPVTTGKEAPDATQTAQAQVLSDPTAREGEIPAPADSTLETLLKEKPAPKAPTPKESDEGVDTDPIVGTSARKVMMDQDREAMGLDGLDSPERRSWASVMDQARKDGTAEKAMRLAGEVNETPRALSDLETAGLVVHATKLKNEHAALLEDIAKTTDPADLAFKGAEAGRIESEFDHLSRALRSSGTEKGRALASHSLTVDKDLSLISVKSRARASKGAELSAEESAKFEQMTAEHAKMTERVAELEKQLAEKTAQRAIRHARRAGRDVPTRQRAGDLEMLVADVSRLLKAGCR